MVQNPEKLQVYNESLDFANDCYSLLDDVTGRFRLKEQLFGSTSSVPANLAEFCSMESKNAQRQKLTLCIGETNETDVWLQMCIKQGLISDEKFKELRNRNKVIRMKLFRLKKVLG